eukprot:CAMPEP_0202863322 /NCGR_PEP_ID=MMETSP1391-20130828/4003_1 /ASSEMBLY_ACC=CAM_ASM_000867 /TAXON_ID=1034604 /ORGANISM="Chlamydomonas leiostraca, Strain SAG 11-49" /LENGTH=105 /DNA_ID=CAMNT_0049542943 /DNA_START=529 /DNA_END=843 /DNA_ORIENTATION=-
MLVMHLLAVDAASLVEWLGQGASARRPAQLHSTVLWRVLQLVGAGGSSGPSLWLAARQGPTGCLGGRACAAAGRWPLAGCWLSGAGDLLDLLGALLLQLAARLHV